MKLLLLLLAYPLGEIAGFVLVGGWIGLLPTLGLVLFSAALGVWLLRSQARIAGRDLRGSLRDFKMPVVTVAEGALVSFGAILLILPGFLSDLAAMPLLIPQVRRALIAKVSRRATFSARAQTTDGYDAPGRRDPTIIDGTYYETDPDPATRPVPDQPSGWTRH